MEPTARGSLESASSSQDSVAEPMHATFKDRTLTGLAQADECLSVRGMLDRLSMEQVLQLSRWERLLWRCGRRPPASKLAKRLFSTLDLNGDGALAIGVLDAVLPHLQRMLPVPPEAFEFVEVLHLLAFHQGDCMQLLCS